MNTGSVAIRGEIKTRLVRFFSSFKKAENPSNLGLSDVAVQRFMFAPIPNRLVSAQLSLSPRWPVTSTITVMFDLLQHFPELLKAYPPGLHDLLLDVA